MPIKQLYRTCLTIGIKVDSILPACYGILHTYKKYVHFSVVTQILLLQAHHQVSGTKASPPAIEDGYSYRMLYIFYYISVC